MTGWFCIKCDVHVESIDWFSPCPGCGSNSVPCLDDNQVTIQINWQELRVLTMWAEFWAQYKAQGDNPEVLYAIAARIQKQHPELYEQLPLTFAGELIQIRDAGFKVVETDFPGYNDDEPVG